MVSVEELMEGCLHLTQQELEEYAWERFVPVRDYLEARYSIKEADEMVFEGLATICAIDGVVTDAEFEILRMIHGFSYAEQKDVQKKVKRYDNKRAIEKTLIFNAGLPYEEKLSFICLAIAILAVDKRYTDRELALLKAMLKY